MVVNLLLLQQTALTEKYNGTSWTEVNDLNTARISSIVVQVEHKLQQLYWLGTRTDATTNI